MDRIIKTPNDCPMDNPNCEDSTYYALTVMTASLGRFLKADFTYWDNDLYVLMFFVSFCSWSGILVFGFARLLSCTKEARKAREIRDQLLNNPEYANSPYRVVLMPPGGEHEAGNIITTSRQAPVDHRATGDGWQAQEFDPDYDVNNDMLVMMLEGNQDEEGSEDGGSALESDEDVEVLHRIIMASD